MIDLSCWHMRARQLLRWCLDHPPQTMLTIMAFMMISNYINVWLFLFAMICFVISGIGLICMMLRDIVQDERDFLKRCRQQREAKRQATRRMNDFLTTLHAGKPASTSPPMAPPFDRPDA